MTHLRDTNFIQSLLLPTSKSAGCAAYY